MGSLEDRMLRRSEDLNRAHEQEKLERKYLEMTSKFKLFKKCISETLQVLEENDWPAGISPRCTGELGEIAHQYHNIEWGICRTSEDKIAYWDIYTQKGANWDDETTDGWFILLRNGRIGYVPASFRKGVSTEKIFMFDLNVEVEWIEYDSRTGGNYYSFASHWSVGFVKLDVDKFIEGMKELQERARKWVTL